MDERLRQDLWESLLQADQEQRYWSQKAAEFVRRDSSSKVVLAVLSSGSVAGWSIWLDVPALWKTLSAAATLLSVGLPIIALNSKSVAMTDLHAQWMQLRHQYQSMWRDQASLTDKLVRDKLDSMKRKEAELSAKAIPLPGDDKELGRLTFNEVIEEWKNHA